MIGELASLRVYLDFETELPTNPDDPMEPLENAKRNFVQESRVCTLCTRSATSGASPRSLSWPLQRGVWPEGVDHR